MWTFKNRTYYVCRNIRKLLALKLSLRSEGIALDLSLYLNYQAIGLLKYFIRTTKYCVGKTFVRHNPINERRENCLQIFFLTHLLIILGKVTSQFLVLTIIANEPFKGHSQWEHLVFTVVGIFNIYLQEECLNMVFVLCELIFVTKGEISTDSILHGYRHVSKQEQKRRDGLWEILMAQ